MGAEIGARAISHLEEVSDAGLKAMADARTIAVLLPTTAYMLRLRAPPARRMIDDARVTVALGSDFNPNAHCLAMVPDDTIRDASLTCARKPTRVSLIYRTETTTKKCKTEKLKSKKRICSEVTVKVWKIM